MLRIERPSRTAPQYKEIPFSQPARELAPEVEKEIEKIVKEPEVPQTPAPVSK